MMTESSICPIFTVNTIQIGYENRTPRGGEWEE